MQTVVVLGMHKSGTSLVAEMLHHGGIEMIEALQGVSYDKGEKYERQETGAINKALLKAENLYSLDVRRELNRHDIDPALTERAQRLVAEMTGRDMDWGFKDPRTCLTWKFWRPILPPHKLICIFRNVDEVHHRYRWRGKWFGLRAMDAWYRYNRAMLNAYQAAAPADRSLIDYHSLMSKADATSELAAFVGRPLEDRRDPKMRRTTRKADLRTYRDALIYLLTTGRNVWTFNRRLRRLSRRQQPVANNQGARAHCPCERRLPR